MKCSRSSPLAAFFAAFAVALPIGILIGVVYVAFRDDWGAAQVGPLASWVSGILTFGGLVVAFVQASRAQREARTASRKADEAALERARDRWELELARRVDVEIANRRDRMKSAQEILVELNSCIVHFVDEVRRAALNFNDATTRSRIGLGLSLHWVGARPRIGVLALSVAGSEFEQVLVKAVGEVDNLYDRAGMISEAQTASDVTKAIPDQNILDEHQESLRATALDEFYIDRETVRDAMAEAMQQYPE